MIGLAATLAPTSLFRPYFLGLIDSENFRRLKKLLAKAKKG